MCGLNKYFAHPAMADIGQIGQMGTYRLDTEAAGLYFFTLIRRKRGSPREMENGFAWHDAWGFGKGLVPARTPAE